MLEGGLAEEVWQGLIEVLAAVVEAKLCFFQVQIEGGFGDAAELGQSFEFRKEGLRSTRMLDTVREVWIERYYAEGHFQFLISGLSWPSVYA